MTARRRSNTPPSGRPESGRHPPHHDHIAQVVTAIEAAGRGPGGWDLELDSDGARIAHLDWGAGAHDPDGDPDAYDADLLLTAHWHQVEGRSYIWGHEAHPDLPFGLARLDLPADADPASAAAVLPATVMSDHTDPARWPKTLWLPAPRRAAPTAAHPAAAKAPPTPAGPCPFRTGGVGILLRSRPEASMKMQYISRGISRNSYLNQLCRNFGGADLRGATVRAIGGVSIWPPEHFFGRDFRHQECEVEDADVVRALALREASEAVDERDAAMAVLREADSYLVDCLARAVQSGASPEDVVAALVDLEPYLPDRPDGTPQP